MNNKIIALIMNIHIHPLFWLIALLAIITARFRELIILFIIVLIHEIGHASAASFFSWRIRKIVLLPFGGVAEFDENGNRPLKEEAYVILAGPLQHLWMIAAAFFFHSQSIISDSDYKLFIEYNLMILLFNCLPIYPLDGGRFMSLLFARLWPFAKALERTIVASLCFLAVYCLCIVLIFPFHLNGWIIAAFLLISLYNEWKNRPFIFMRFLLDRQAAVPVGKNQLPLSVHSGDSIQSVVERFKRGVHHKIIVYDSGKLIKQITEPSIINAYFQKKSIHATINDLHSIQ